MSNIINPAPNFSPPITSSNLQKQCLNDETAQTQIHPSSKTSTNVTLRDEITNENKTAPTNQQNTRIFFKKSHTCGSLFAKCNCYNNENSEKRAPLLQTFSHPISESYSSIRKLSNPKNTQKQTKNNDSRNKRSSNPEISNQIPLKHPDILYPLSKSNKLLSNSVPKQFESYLNNTSYIANYLKNFHPATYQPYNKKFPTTSYASNANDSAQKYFEESGIFGPMGNGVTIRRNSNNDTTTINQIRKVSKTMCIENKCKNTDDYEYLKSVVTQLKKELSDNEIKVENLEKELIQAKKELHAKESEVLKLQQEVHKLKSVLQQATSLCEDSNILATLQEQHGMANRILQQSQSNSSCSKKQGVSAESREFIGQASDIQITRYEKDFRSKQQIKDAIMENDFLKNLDSSQVREIVDSVYSKEFEENSYVIREGEAGAHLYVSAEGDYEIIKDGKVLGKMGPGKAFGELAILYNCTRTASIKAVTNCRVWVLDRKVFQQIMMRTGLQRLQDNISFLKSVPLLQNLNNDVLAKIADVLEVEFYPAGAYIIRQGASGDTFFIISSGSVKVTQRFSGRLVEEEIRILSRGEYFGEQALLKEEFRTASIIALHPGVECLTLDRDHFIQLIGDLSELQEKDYGDEHRVLTRPNSSVNVTQDVQAKEETFEKETNEMTIETIENDIEIEEQRRIIYEKIIYQLFPPEYENIRLDDLEVISTLGIGGFGRVELVQYAYDHNLTFALKCLKKQHIVDTQQQEHVFSEKNIMLSCRSPFICRMYRTFKDSKYVYMLLEACLGGEVWTILRDRGCFDDHTTRFITGCVIEAFSYLHTRGIIYRDLKPENLLLDSKGYVKLVDFGFSKRLGYSSKTWTFCGTPEYVSPETILNKGHDRAVDYWGLGILMHELLTGSPPFTASDPMKTYNLILKGIDMVDFPRHVSRTAQSLIKRLCRDLPSERLGYQRGGIQDIKKHKWFQGFDWDGLKARTLPAPIVQAVRSPQDSSNFDCYNKDNDIPPDEFSGWDLEF